MISIFYSPEVERQLGTRITPASTAAAAAIAHGSATPQLPSKKPRTGSTSSAAKQQAPSSDPLPPPMPSDNTTPVLTTFGGARANNNVAVATTPRELPPPSCPSPVNDGGGLQVAPQGLLSTKSTVVQLRRNTNKKGRQAPTPPRRTRYVIKIL